MKKILLIVDLQRDFCKDGALGIPTADKIVPIVNKIIPLYDTVLASKDWHPFNTVHFEKWPIHCVAESSGADFHADLDSHLFDYVFLKGTDNKDDGYSAFEATNTHLDTYLKEHHVSDLDVCGLTTDYCVRETTLDALRLGYKVRVITDAIDAVNVSPGDGDRALAEMAAAGAVLITSNEL
jgi:nicotinamidase/pyrazinamidase